MIFRRTLIALPLAALCGCLNYGPELRERATVTQTHFVAPQTTVEISLDADGHITPHPSTTSPEYWVAFSCAHGQFAVSDHETWKAVKPGEQWLVVYREGRDGKGIVQRLHFVRVEPIGAERGIPIVRDRR